MIYSLNLRKDVDDFRDFPFMCSLDVSTLKSGILASRPSSIDHSDLMSPVKDQGQLGSCVGFAVTAMKEWQEQKEHQEEVAAGKANHRDEKYYDLSESWVYWSAKKIDGWPNDEGTSIRYGMKVLSKIGVPCEKAWPYSDEVKGEPEKWANLVAIWSLIGSYYRINNLDELKTALLQGPVVIGIGCYEEIFDTNETGVVSMPLRPQYCYGGHAICVCGYDDMRSLIKFKNSWGDSWGDKGYGYLQYDYIRNYMWDAWACKDLSVTKSMLKGARSLIS